MKHSDLKAGGRLRRLAVASLVLIATAGMLVGGARAGQQTGTVIRVQVNKDYGGGVVTFNVSGAAPTGQPACVTDPGRWTLKTTDNNPLNDETYAMLLTALTTGLQVTVYGADTCSVISWVEDIVSVQIDK